MAISWLPGKHANRIGTQPSRHKVSKEQRIGRVRDRKQAKIAREYHLPAFPVEVAGPVVAHINSTAYPEEAKNSGQRKDAFYFTAREAAC